MSTGIHSRPHKSTGDGSQLGSRRGCWPALDSDSELLAAIEARAETEHATTSEIIREAIRRFLDVASVINSSQSETSTSKRANGSQTSDGLGAHSDMNPLRHKDLSGTPGVTRTPNLRIRNSWTS